MIHTFRNYKCMSSRQRSNVKEGITNRHCWMGTCGMRRYTDERSVSINLKLGISPVTRVNMDAVLAIARIIPLIILQKRQDASDLKEDSVSDIHWMGSQSYTSRLMPLQLETRRVGHVTRRAHHLYQLYDVYTAGKGRLGLPVHLLQQGSSNVSPFRRNYWDRCS